MKTYIEVLKKYAVFTGRATRKEYWIFLLVNIGIVIALRVLGSVLQMEDTMFMIAFAYILAVTFPSVGVLIRRLHDTGRTGLWFLLNLVPFIGPIVVLIFTLLDSQPGENKYGPNPKSTVAGVPPTAPLAS
jgi:uncharacterized membrane protein YhaH (DUF805 family)